GNALKFYASQRLDIRRIGAIKNGEEVVGSRTRVKVVKNKLAPPYRQAEFDILFHGEEIGLSREGDLLDIGVERGVVDKSGAWFSSAGQRLGQGREHAREFLHPNAAVAAALEARLRAELGLAPVAAGDPEAAAEAQAD
ncbi:MAG: DNA recombination/repair protein RecA, partial [Gemmatimonadota bacterium]